MDHSQTITHSVRLHQGNVAALAFLQKTAMGQMLGLIVFGDSLQMKGPSNLKLSIHTRSPAA